MASRREFLQVGIAAAVLPLAASVNGSAPDERLDIYKVVVDERFPSSLAFGAEMQKSGAPVHVIRGDITDLWFHDLYHRWKQGPVTIAGMTAQGALFCLERLAWDQGMRVVSRTDHAPVGDHEPLISWIIAPKPKAERT
jgi:hypothetical protein